jgi:hypothetical protein
VVTSFDPRAEFGARWVELLGALAGLGGARVSQFGPVAGVWVLMSRNVRLQLLRLVHRMRKVRGEGGASTGVMARGKLLI